MNKSIEDLIREIDRRVEDKVLQSSEGELLKKLIHNADNFDEAMDIARMGTVYKRTGLHFTPRTEKPTDKISYFKKNNDLSFKDENSELTHKLIIGENYDALRNLLIQYRNKVDVIYIDPPYAKDSMGEFAKTNYENAITRDNLLSMMYSRLLLAKQLLSDDGVIFCSIDDKNQAYLKCLFDDVFGEKNFVCNFMWKKTETPPSLSNKVRKKLEYVLCYTKRYSSNRVFAQGYIDGGDAPLLNAGNPLGRLEFPIGTIRFKIPDGIYSNKDGYSIKIIDKLVVKDGVNATPLIAEAHFKWGQDNLKDEIDNGTYFLIKSDKFSIRYQKEGNTTKKPSNIIDNEVNVGTNETANSEIEKLGLGGQFDYAKPVSLISFLLKMGFWKDDNITVLDFFAGSGTTGQAVLDLNTEGGNRTFILCQINEHSETNPNGIVYNVTSKRLKRIMTGECYDGSKDFEWIKENKPYGGSLDVYEIDYVSDKEHEAGKTAFDVIDETLYGKERFTSPREKVDWVCQNFQTTQKKIESDKEWEAREREKAE